MISGPHLLLVMLWLADVKESPAPVLLTVQAGQATSNLSEAREQYVALNTPSHPHTLTPSHQEHYNIRQELMRNNHR